MEPIAVDCQFNEDGTVRVRRVKVRGAWQSVAQGRQWLDDEGRHVLIMLDDTDVRTLKLDAGSLSWEITPDQSSGTAVV